MLIDNCGSLAGNFHEIYDNTLQKRAKAGKDTSDQDKKNIDFFLYEAYKKICVNSPNAEVVVKSMEALQKKLSQGNTDILDIPKIAVSINSQLTEDYIAHSRNNIDSYAVTGNNVNNYNEYTGNETISETSIIAGVSVVSTVELYKSNIQKIANSDFSEWSKKGLEKNITEAKQGNETANQNIMQIRIADEMYREVSIDPKYLEDPVKRKQYYKRTLEAKASGDKTAYATYLKIAEKMGYGFVARDKDGNLVDNEEELLTEANEYVPNSVKKYKSGELAEKLQRRNGLINKRAKPERLHNIDKLNGITKDNMSIKHTKKALEKAIEEGDEAAIKAIYEQNPEYCKHVLKDKLKLCEQLNSNSPTSSKIPKLEKECMAIGNVLSEVTKEKEDNSVRQNPENPSSKINPVNRDDEDEER